MEFPIKTKEYLHGDKVGETDLIDDVKGAAPVYE